MKQTQLLIILGVAIVALGGGFFGGMQYQKMQSPYSQRQGQLGNGPRGGSGTFGRNGGNRPVVGEILSQDDKSITVKMQDGSSKIVLISDSTTINKASAGTKTDLQTGVRVGVFGTNNSDGSVTAQNVQINPLMRQDGQNNQPSPTTKP